MRSRSLVGGVVLAAIASTLLASVPASAVVLPPVVDDDGLAAVGDCDAMTPAHPTIQAAVTAASSGDTVTVCPGVYPETVDVPKTLTLIGAQAGVDARTRSVPGSEESIVDPPDVPAQVPAFTLGADDIVLDGFVVRGTTDNAGIFTLSTFAGYRIQNSIVRRNVFGIYLHSAGGDQSIVRFNRIHNNNRPGAASGNGIYSDQGARGILIRANRIDAQTNSGILFANSGVDQSNIVIQRNQGTNDSSFVTLFDTQNVQVLANRHTDTVNANDGDQGSTIFIGGDTDGTLVQENRLSNAPFSAIAVRDTLAVTSGATNVDILENRVVNAERHGIDVTTVESGAVQVRGNDALGNDVDGISFGPDTVNNLVRRNVALDNGDLDCHDESTGTNSAGTANFWRNNTGVTDDPSGLCRPPEA